MSMCQVSRYAQTAPLRLPPWLTATAVSLAIFRNGTTPCDSPLVPRILAPMPRTGVQSLPRPPEYLASRALLRMPWKMPARSSSTVVRKHDDSCGRVVPELNSVGVDDMNRNELSSS